VARYLIVPGGWSHIFADEHEAAECRFVYDCETEELEAVAIMREGRWIRASGAHFRDLQDSLDNAHPDFPEKYRPEGSRKSSAKPVWAMSTKERIAAVEVAAERRRQALLRPKADEQLSFVGLLEIGHAN
jgi:hypothetical protein